MNLVVTRGCSCRSIVILLGVALAVFLTLPCASAQSSRQIEDLLPADTLFFSGVEDMAAARNEAETMPLFAILEEEEEVRSIIDCLVVPQIEFVATLLGCPDGKLPIDPRQIGKCFVALLHLVPPNDELGIEKPDLGLVIGAEFGDTEQNLIRLLRDLLVGTVAEGDRDAAETIRYRGVTLEQIVLPGEWPQDIWLFRVDGIDFVALSRNAAQKIVDCRQDQTTRSLADRSEYSLARKNCTIKGKSAVKCWIDLYGLAAVARRAIEIVNEDELDAEHIPFAVDSLGALYGLGCPLTLSIFTHSVDGRAYSCSFMTVMTVDDDPSIMPQRDDLQERLEKIPADVLSLDVCRLDLERLCQVAAGICTAGYVGAGYGLDLDPVMERLLELGSEMDNRFAADCTAFRMKKGDTACLLLEVKEFDRFLEILREPLAVEFSGQAAERQDDGTWTVTHDIAADDDEDEDELTDEELEEIEAVMDGFLTEEEEEKTEAETSLLLSLESTTFEGSTIHYFKANTSRPDQSLRDLPAFTHRGDHVVFAANVRSLKSFLQECSSPSASSVLSNEAFRAMFDALPPDKDLVELSWADIPEIIFARYSRYYSGWLMLATLFSPGGDQSYELPSPDSIARHLSCGFKAGFKVEGGYLWISEGPVGAEVAGFLFPVDPLTGLFFNTKQLKAQLNWSCLSVALNLAMPWQTIRTDENRIVDASYEEFEMDVADRIEFIEVHIEDYLFNHGELPESLDVLLESDEALGGGGYINRKDRLLDPWGFKFHYKKESASRYVIFSLGADGVEGGTGENADVSSDNL